MKRNPKMFTAVNAAGSIVMSDCFDINGCGFNGAHIEQVGRGWGCFVESFANDEKASSESRILFLSAGEIAGGFAVLLLYPRTSVESAFGEMPITCDILHQCFAPKDYAAFVNMCMGIVLDRLNDANAIDPIISIAKLLGSKEKLSHDEIMGILDSQQLENTAEVKVVLENFWKTSEMKEDVRNYILSKM